MLAGEMTQPSAQQTSPVSGEHGVVRRTTAPTLLTQLPLLLGALVTVAGVIVLIGWATGISLLTGIGPGDTSILPVTAVAFTGCGIALALLGERRRPLPTALDPRAESEAAPQRRAVW